MELKDFIMVKDGTLPSSMCDILLQVYKEANKVRSGVGDTGIDENARIADEFNLSTDGNCDVLHHALTNYTMNAYNVYRNNISDYLKHFPKISQMSVESFRIKHYTKDIGYYDEHVDNVGQRMFAVIFYLNDVKLGGETEFPYLKYQVTPKIERCVIFPTTWQYPHKANIPTSNDKYIVQGYLNDLR